MTFAVARHVLDGRDQLAATALALARLLLTGLSLTGFPDFDSGPTTR